MKYFLGSFAGLLSLRKQLLPKTALKGCCYRNVLSRTGEACILRRRIWNPVKYLWWRFLWKWLLQVQLKLNSRLIFDLINSHLWLFKAVLSYFFCYKIQPTRVAYKIVLDLWDQPYLVSQQLSSQIINRNVASSIDSSLLHLMRAITHTHASTRATSFTRVKNSMRHFCLWYLLSWVFEWRKWKKVRNIKYNG